MTSLIDAPNPGSTSKMAVGSSTLNGKRSISTPMNVNASSAALSTAAAVAAMNSNRPIQQRAPPNANEAQRRQLQPNDFVATKRVMNQVFPRQRQHNNMNVNVNGNVPQHHLVMNPIHLSPPYPIAGKYTTPTVFTNMKLRRGKWTQEEERFANALIEEFEKGAIQDCENGCTLRAFLSRKLHCAPMRISKKYAGKSIGKHVFLSRNSAAASHSHQPVQRITSKLRRLEFQFHMSLVQEGSPGMEHDSMKMGQAFLSGNEFNPMMPGYSMAFQPNVITNKVGTGINVPHPCQGLPNQPQPVFQWSVPTIPQTGQPAQNLAWPNSAMQMQQSLYTAFKDAHTSSPLRAGPQSTILMPQTNSHLIDEKVLHVASTVTAERCVGGMSDEKNCNTGGFSQDHKSKIAAGHQSNMITYGDRPPTQLVTNGTKQDDDIISCGSQPSVKINQPRLHDVNVPGEQEQEMLNMKEKKGWIKSEEHQKWSHDVTRATPSVYTPKNLKLLIPPTSIPLDELNLSTCGGLTSLPSLELYPSAIDEKKDLDENCVSDLLCDSLLPADAYALFAQQSAMAVSKHSAYCMADAAVSHPDTESRVSHSPVHSKRTSKANNPQTAQKEMRQGLSLSCNDGSAFNATNLQIHRKAAEEKDRVDQASKETRNTSCDAATHTSIDISVTSRHGNIVSGSEQSSDMSAESAAGSTGMSFSGSGSDNAYDDSASDEIPLSSIRSKLVMSHKHDFSYSSVDDVPKIGDPPMKRQKLSVMVLDV